MNSRDGRSKIGRATPVIMLGVVYLGFLAGSASEARPFKAELEDLIRTNPKLLAAAKSVEAAREGVREADSEYLPQVSVSGDIGPQYVDSPSRRAVQAESFRGTAQTSTLSVTQNIFQGYRAEGLSRIAGLQKDVSSLNLDITRQTVLFDGIRAYTDVLKQTKLLEIAKINERTIQNQLELESARVERGSGLAVDVLQAKSRLQLARERVVRIMGDLRQALSVYIEQFGRPAAPAQMAMPPLPSDVIPENVDGALSSAAAQNTLLKRSNTQISIADEQRTVARSTYWPRIDLVGEATWEKDVDGVNGVRRDGKVVLRASWDLFDGYLTPAKTGRAAAQYGVALDTRLTTDREVQNRVRRTWVRYQTTAEQRDLLENAVNIASEVFDARQKLRQRGRESVINLLDAENELNNARLRYNEAVFDHAVSAYRLLLQVGLLTPETLKLQ